MSAVHTCFRSALIQAFRPSTSDAAASWTVPAFLVPACGRRRGRPFSSTKRRCVLGEIAPPSERAHEERITWEVPPKPQKSTISRCIPLPADHERADIEPWLSAIDPFLPPHLRRSRPGAHGALGFNLAPDASVTAEDVAYFLVAAQHSSHDILSHVGLAEQRWDTVLWITKRLAGDGNKSIQTHVKLDPFSDVILPEQKNLSLHELTDNAFRTRKVRSLSNKLGYSLDQITSMPETIDVPHRLVKRALGQLWRTLGTMILAAAEDDQPEHATVMHRALEILAYLHHMGYVPDSVYAHKPEPNNHALQQPPTLHILSTQILNALSDAQWKAHEESVKVATERLNAEYFLGHEIPGSRYKLRVAEVAPALWLELVLWSCIHGGWTLDGSAILEKVASHQGKQPWTLTSWKELLQAEQEEQEHVAAHRGWGLFRARDTETSHADQRTRLQRTISSEVVTAMVDGLVTEVRLAVGVRGIAPEYLVERIKNLKRFLDHNSLSLGSITWDSMMSRLLETGSIVPEKRPEMLLSIVDLASEFGSEVSAVNASKPTVAKSEPPYFFEPTTVPVSLLHRTIRSFIQNGDIAGAMGSLQKLQDLTDQNKQKSLMHFFETLKTIQLRQEEPFTSRLPPIEFPAFENQLSVPLLAKLLDLITDAKIYDLGRWFFFSKDLDGPLIRPNMYGNFLMAAAIIRFGTMAGEHDLVLKIVKMYSGPSTAPGTGTKYRMPHEFFIALLRSQIKLHRWKSVQAMQNHVLQNPGFKVKPVILAQFAAELLRLSVPEEAKEGAKRDAREAFTNMLFTWENLVLNDMRNELYCILAILSSIHVEWKEHCSQFLAFSAAQSMQLSTGDFNNILGGVLDGYGTLKAREVVEMWCYTPPRTFEPYRAPGGLPTMSKFRPTKAEEYESHPDNIEIHQASGAKLILRGRIHPNRQTVWAILRNVQQELEELQGKGEEISVAKRGEMRETLKWAARLLYYMGFDYEDIIRDLGSLAELAELHAPPAPTARLWADGPGL